MARPDPQTPLPPTHPSTRTATSPPSPTLDPDAEFAAWLGERLRRLALGLTAALVTLRAYWPSEPDLKAEGGQGLVWVLAVLVTTGLALASALVGGRLRVRFTWNDAALIALMLLVGTSATRASDHRTAVNLAWEWAGVGLTNLLLRSLPRTRGESEAVALALVAAAAAVAAYGLYQVGVELEALREFYRKDPSRTLRLLGIAPGSTGQTALEQRLLWSNEPWSTFALANSLAGFLVGPLVLLLAVAWEHLSRRNVPEAGKGRSAPSRWAALALTTPVVLLMLVCLIATKSRSAYLGLVVGALAVLGRGWGKVRRRTIAVTAGIGLAVVVALTVAGLATGRLDRQVLTESPKSLRYRFEYWAGTWRLITSRPGVFWGGVGPGNFGWAYVRYKLPRSSEEINDPHNLLLEVWATAGVGAAVALAAALGLGLWNIFGPSRRPKGGLPHREPDAPPLPFPAEEPPRRPGWVLLCAGCGLVWLTFWSLVILFEGSDQNGNMYARWSLLGLGWGAAVLCVRLLWRRLPVPALGLGAAALATVVNLLAAGGIGIPAVALMLWALVAVGLNLRDDRPCGRLRETGERLPAFGLAVVWAALTGLFAGSALTYWRTEHYLAQAEAALRARPPDYRRANEAYLAAVKTDRFSARPWLGLSYMEYRAWRDRGALPQDRRWNQIAVTMAQAVKPPRNPYAWSLHRERALISRQILDQIGGSLGPKDVLKLRADAVQASRSATLLYPTNASLHALLAESSAEIGKLDDAARAAAEALRLDEDTPHADKKLPEPVRRHLEAQLPEWSRAARSSK